MAKAAKQTDTKPAAEGLMSGGSIDQIREILFGATQREHEARSGQLEKRIQRGQAEAAERVTMLQASIERQLEKLSADLTSRLDQLAQRIDEAEAAAKRDTAAAAKDLSEQISALDKRLSGDLRDQGESLEQKIEDLRSEMTTATDRLEQEKTGKLNLGDYLMEIGMRLKGDPGLGAIESSLNELLKNASDEQA